MPDNCNLITRKLRLGYSGMLSQSKAKPQIIGGREGERERQRQRERDRDTETERQRQRQRHRDRDREREH